jgi:hypothetical protein
MRLRKILLACIQDIVADRDKIDTEGDAAGLRVAVQILMFGTPCLRGALQSPKHRRPDSTSRGVCGYLICTSPQPEVNGGRSRSFILRLQADHREGKSAQQTPFTLLGRFQDARSDERKASPLSNEIEFTEE